MDRCKIFFERLEKDGWLENGRDAYFDFCYRMKTIPQIMQAHQIPISTWANLFETCVGKPYHLSQIPSEMEIEKFWIEPWRLEQQKLSSHIEETSESFLPLSQKELSYAHLSASSHRVEKLLCTLLEAILEKQATDLHIDSLDDRTILYIRQNGTLLPYTSLPLGIGESLCNRIKLAASLALEHRQGPQDGRFSYRTAKEKLFDIRLGVMPTLYGESLSLRFLPQFTMFRDLEALGFQKEEANALLDIQEGGLYLVTGPAGSGKTTTLYTLLESIQKQSLRSVYTVEDPIERVCLGLVQIPVQEKQHVGFAEALRGILRMDPDVIMIGELRDEETVALAARAALTGHAVFATLHCRDCFDAVERLRDLRMSDAQIASTLQYVVAQRLQPSDTGRVLEYEVWHVQSCARDAIRQGVAASVLRMQCERSEIQR